MPRPTPRRSVQRGDYATGSSRGRPDLATPYLRATLGFIGLNEVGFVPIGPTIGPDDAVKATRDHARETLQSLATTFLGETVA